MIEKKRNENTRTDDGSASRIENNRSDKTEATTILRANGHVPMKLNHSSHKKAFISSASNARQRAQNQGEVYDANRSRTTTCTSKWIQNLFLILFMWQICRDNVSSISFNGSP